MNKRNFFIGGVIVIAIIAIGLLLLQRNGTERILRRTISNNQAQASEAAAALQRTDRITTVLCGVSSPLAQGGAQTCTAIFVRYGLWRDGLHARFQLTTR